MHTAVANENGKFYTTVVYPSLAGRYVFRWDRLLDEGFGLCSYGSSLVSRWREIQMWRRRCKQIDPQSFGGRQMRFWLM